MKITAPMAAPATESRPRRSATQTSLNMRSSHAQEFAKALKFAPVGPG